ncbi:MAG: glutamine--fructose-6-phosphate transaminase (isomerizing) [Planctomycetes bacterium]|nr:glutamine--fructose-6-phosphate transaminase (isomerizing) [Planctomycetota bacterium]
MCGIVGYIGNEEAMPILMSGLTRLEYRGYDSAGICCITPENTLEGDKRAGKLATLKHIFKAWQPKGTIGIGHTRWATHGAPTRENAHPHNAPNNKISIVHNGIIENYDEIRQKLINKGYEFKSETDTEVIAILINDFIDAGLNFEDAFRKTIMQLQGSWALLAINTDEPDKIIAARKDSPLVVGIGDNCNYFASDVPAILEYTRSIMYLMENDIAVIKRDSVRIEDCEGVEQKRDISQITWNMEDAEKGGEPHFMIKEIKEQPAAAAKTIGAYCNNGETLEFPELTLTTDDINKIDRIIIEACGTAYHAGLVAKYYFEELVKIPTEVIYASEFRYANPVVTENTLIIAITQSGETEDTKKAMLLGKKLGAKTLTICNVVDSSIPRESDSVIYTLAGPEIAVASTKAYTTQVLTMLMVAMKFGFEKGTLAPDRFEELKSMLKTMPDLMQKTIESSIQSVQSVAHYCTFAPSFMYLGRRYNLATAFEGALKLKEITYIHAEGYGAGEMKHGPIALVDNTFPVIAIISKGIVQDKIISNLKEIEARNGIIIAIATENMPDVRKLAHYIVEYPETEEIFSPLLAVIPLQLLAYYVSVNRQIDPDKPRNLAKSVTVE